MSVIENRISGYLYNKVFSESNEEKCTVFQKSMAYSVIVHKNTIKNCSTALQGFSFRSLLLYFLFHKGKDTSAIPQSSVQHLVHVFPIFFRFHKCFINFHINKNILINKFFHWNMCFFIVWPPWPKGVFRFSLKQNNVMRLKMKRFLFVLTDNHTEIWNLFLVR